MAIKEFKLAWRFTNEKYALFSQKELSQIKIISPQTSASLWSEVCDNEVLPRS